IVTGCTDNQAWLWDVTTWTSTRRLIGHTNAVLFATFSHSGKFVATGSRDFTARVWDQETGRQVGEPLPHGNWVDFVAFSPDDRVKHVAFSPDGHRIVTGCIDGTVRVWDLAGIALGAEIKAEHLCEDKTRYLTISNGAVRVSDTISSQPLSAWIRPGGRVVE